MKTNGAIVLGSREMRVRLEQQTAAILNGLAKRYGMSSTTLAEQLLHNAVQKEARDAITLHVINVVAAAWACSGGPR